MALPSSSLGEVISPKKKLLQKIQVAILTITNVKV